MIDKGENMNWVTTHKKRGLQHKKSIIDFLCWSPRERRTPTQEGDDLRTFWNRDGKYTYVTDQ
jgi:hypothetical protein